MKHLSIILLSLLALTYTLVAQYDADTQDFFDRAEVLDPDAFDLTSNHPALTPTYVKGQWDAYVKRLKADGVWADMTEIVPLAWISFDALGCKLKYDTSTNAAYTSDFSAGADSWTGQNGTWDGNIDSIGGEDDTLRFTISTGTTNSHWLIKSYSSIGVSTGQYVRITGRAYIPSGQSHIDGIGFGQDTEYSEYFSPALDTWFDVSFEGIASSQIRIRAADGGSYSITDPGGDDVFYVKDIVVTELSPSTAINSGFVSGDYDAIQGTTGDGSSYFDSGYWFPNFDGNDLHFGIAQMTVADANETHIGIETTEFGTYIAIENTPSGSEINFYKAPNTDAFASESLATGVRVMSRRNSSNDFEAYRDGVSIGTDTSYASISSTTWPGNLYLFARSTADDPGNPRLHSSQTLAAAHYGNGLTDQQVSDAYEALDTLRFSMEAPPSVILAGGPRDIGHTDAGYGYWDPTTAGLSVVYVTSLADSGTGTYREAVDGQSNVWVKFSVEGTIELKSRVTGGSNVFIDGSTAPGIGITIKNDDTVFDTQDQIWIQDITFRAGDYLLPMPDRIRDFEDQGGGVWRSSNRFWARLTDDAHIQDTVGDGAVNPGVMFSSTGDTADLVELTRAASEGAVGAGEFYLDASDDELFINTGNGDGSDVNTGLLIVRPIKAQHPDCLSISNSTNIVITHCTLLEGTDITYRSDNNRYQTFRANIVGRGVGYKYHIEQTNANLLKGAFPRGIHAKGALFKMDSGETNRNLDTLIDRNLWIDIYDRSPRCASGGEYLITNNYGVGVDGMDVQLTNDTFGDGQVSLIGNYWDTESATDYTEVFGVPYLRIDDNGSVYMADGTPDEANFWGGSLQNSDPIGTEASPADFSNNAGGDIPVGSLLSSAHDTVTGQTILSAADAKTWVTRNAGPRPDRNRPAIVNELLTRAANPPASFYWPVNNGIVPFDGYDPDAEYYFRRAKALDPVAFDLSSIDGSYTTSANKAAINTLIERLKDAGVWTDTAEWLNLAGVSYDAIAAKLKRDTSETITYQSLFASGTDSFAARLGTAAGNIDSVGGENDTLRFTTSSTTSGLHLYRSSFLTAGRHYKIRFSFYYPSSNSDIDGVQIRSNSTTMAGATWSSRAADTWHELSANIIWPATGELRFYALEGGSFAGDAGADDLFYLKDIIVRAVSPSEFILNNFTSSEYLAAGSGAGLTGDGSTMYIDSGYWFPNLSGNDLSLSAWVNGSPASSSALIGSTNSTTAVMSIQDNTTNLLYNGPDSDAAITGSASTTGLLTLSRRSTTDIAGLLNGVSDGTDSSSASVSSSDYAANVGLFARLDDVAGAENYTDGTLAAAAYGSGWTTAQTLAAYKALRDYLRTIGAN